MEKIFDFHFHLLFKHYISTKHNTEAKYSLSEEIKTNGLASALNDIFGGPFDSQSSPSQVKNSQLSLGVTALLSVEYAFAEKILNIGGINLRGILPLDWKLIDATRRSETSYWAEFNRQIDFHLESAKELVDNYSIQFLNRSDKRFAGKKLDEIKEVWSGAGKLFAMSIEGGHNFSNVPIRNNTGQLSTDPETRLKQIQDRKDVDFISINLCHLSDIPEQRLGGFAQGLNSTSQIAFHSNDFFPKSGIGITETGKRFIRQALSHPEKPVLIDVKHMSVYSRLDYYRLRDKMITENPNIERLPIISSHTGFTFTTIDDYIKNKKFRSNVSKTDGVMTQATVESENRRIGRTNDIVNGGLFCNPWTINLFDEEIAEIMQSGGMIGISIDQRILGASNPAVDSLRDKYYEQEYIAPLEWDKLFEKGQLPGVEGLFQTMGVIPSRAERHAMLLCLHIVHAIRVGYASLNWVGNDSPWRHICLGTDFDGLINPINGVSDVKDLGTLRKLLKKYLPHADKYLQTYDNQKALKYNQSGAVDELFLSMAIEHFLYQNGLHFIQRYITNWTQQPALLPMDLPENVAN